MPECPFTRRPCTCQEAAGTLEELRLAQWVTDSAAAYLGLQTEIRYSPGSTPANVVNQILASEFNSVGGMCPYGNRQLRVRQG